MSELSLTLSRNAELICPAAERVAGFVRDSGLPENVGFQLRLALSEALNNLVEHDSSRDGDEGIVVYCRICAGELTLTIQDSGQPMPSLPNRCFPDPWAERGRGWPLIRHWADKLHYRAVDGRNILTLSKTLP